MFAVQMSSALNHDYDVAIIGGGPAGLSAAIVLGRCLRSVIVFDHGRPRNYAAQAIHGYLGLKDIAPPELRRVGREQAVFYGVKFRDHEVTASRILEHRCPTRFQLSDAEGVKVTVRKILLATGLRDALPAIENIAEFYGISVHHCQYCDAWEHRDEHFAAFGQGSSAVGLAVALRGWSSKVTACTNGVALSEHDEHRLAKHGIRYRQEPVVALRGEQGQIREVVFDNGLPLSCDCLFFHTEQFQCSTLPRASAANAMSTI